MNRHAFNFVFLSCIPIWIVLPQFHPQQVLSAGSTTYDEALLLWVPAPPACLFTCLCFLSSWLQAKQSVFWLEHSLGGPQKEETDSTNDFNSKSTLACCCLEQKGSLGVEVIHWVAWAPHKKLDRQLSVCTQTCDWYGCSYNQPSIPPKVPRCCTKFHPEGHWQFY